VATLRPDLAEAVGSLLRADSARVVALADRLRGPDRLIESTLEGRSMGPGLPPGSRIRIGLVERADHGIGDVIAFLSGGRVVVHRVVHRGRAGRAAGLFLTRGDAVLVPDPPVDPRAILGAVTGVWREGRWTSVEGPSRRSLPARTLARPVLWTAALLLRLSPRATAGALGLLHGCEGALRCVLFRGLRRRAAAPAPP
jgi:hypothetical protein